MIAALAGTALAGALLSGVGKGSDWRLESGGVSGLSVAQLRGVATEFSMADLQGHPVSGWRREVKVGAGGRLRISLPAEVEADLKPVSGLSPEASSCERSVLKVSDPKAQIGMLSVRVRVPASRLPQKVRAEGVDPADRNPDTLVDLLAYDTRQEGTRSVQRSMMYADGPVEVLSEQRCNVSGRPYLTRVDVKLSRGWNEVITEQVQSAQLASVVTRSGPASAEHLLTPRNVDSPMARAYIEQLHSGE